MSDGPAAADHLSLDALAELEEGIGADDEASRRHLAGCATCRSRAGQLRASRALLSALAPEPMPADVAARIDAALAAEPAPARAFVAGADIVPMRGGRRAWWRGPNVAAAAAGVAVLALGSALLFGHLGGGRAPGESAAKGAHQPGNQPLAGVAPGPLKQWQTGANYSLANLRGLVTGIVLANPPPFPPSTVSGPKPSTLAAGKPSYSLEALRQPANVAACAELMVGHPVRPIAADYARFGGAPAVIIVVPGLQDPAGQLAVYIFRSVCSDDVTDFVLKQIPRPR